MIHLIDNISKLQLVDLVYGMDNRVSFIDENRVYRIVNEAYVNHFNKPIEEIIGKTLWDILGVEAYERVVKEHFDRALVGEELFFEDWFYFSPTHKEYLHVHYKPMVNKEHKVIGVLATITDLTESMKIREEKEHYKQMMFNQSRMAQLGEMIAFLSHQWRQPLNSLGINLLQIQKSLHQHFSEKDKNIISESEKILEQLSQNLEDLHRFYNHDNVEYQSVNLKTTVEQAKSLLEQRLHKGRISMHIDISPDCAILYHTSHMLHILIVFLENSIEALTTSDNKEKTVTVTCKKEDENMVIDIYDNGPGVEPYLFDKLFEAGASSKVDKGHGYGLYFANKMIKDHLSGHIDILPVNNGAFFQIVIPIV